MLPPSERDLEPDDRAVDGHVPVEPAAAVAVLVFLLQDPVAREQVGVVLAEQPKPVAGQAERLGAVLVAGADTADVAGQHQAPALAQGPAGAHTHDRVDPVLVALDLAVGVDAEVREVELPLQLGVQIGVASAGIWIDRERQRPGGTQSASCHVPTR